MIGGNGSARPRLTDVLVEDLTQGDVLTMVADYYKQFSKRERMGRMVDRGWAG